MALHPGDEADHAPEELTAVWDPIRGVTEAHNNWYRDLIEHSHDLLCLHDLEGHLLSINPIPARLLGYSVKEMLCMRLSDLIDPRFRNQCSTYLEETKRKGESHGLMAVTARSGEKRILEYHSTLRTEGLTIPVVRAIAHDVTERVQAEKALRATNDRLLKTADEREGVLRNLTLFRTLLDQSTDTIEVIDPQTLRFLDVNQRLCVELGYSRGELLSMSVPDVVPHVEHMRSHVEQHLRDAGFFHFETERRRKDESLYPVEVSLRAVQLDRSYVLAVGRDITERKRSAAALEATNEQLIKALREQAPILQGLTLFRTLLDQSNDAIQVLDPESLRFLDVNEKACIDLGYSREELLSMTVFDIDKDIDESWRASVRQRIRESGFALMERVHWRKDGTSFPVEVNLRRVQLDRDYGVAVTRDITARKLAEGRLQEFERVVENLEDMIVVVDRDYRYVLANRTFLSYRGLTREQVVGHLASEIVSPADFETIKPKLEECFRGKVVKFELRSRYPEIGERDLFVTFLPVEGTAGIDRVAAVLRDITDEKRAEEALRASEARERAKAKELEAVLDAVPAAVYIARDPDCRVITGNRAAHQQLRVPAGMNLSHSAFPAERPTFRLLRQGEEISLAALPMQQAAATGTTVYGQELTVQLEDGTEREILSNAVPLLDDEGKPRGAVGTSIDLTELKLAEKALRESERHFRTVFQRSPLGIALVDSRSGQFLECNPKYCEIVGRQEAELLQLDAFSITHGDDIAPGIEYQRQLEEEKLASYEIDKRYIRPDGSTRWVRILVVPLWDKEETQRCQMALVQDITDRKRSEEAIASLVREVCEAKKKLTEEKLYLEQEIDTELGFGEIIGQSKALRDVMEQVGKVASSNATVLLLGETGTGKELVARALHRLSRRSQNSFIKMNCAAIPSGLLESELFGHERGAFTGAVSRKIGRLELADKGTLFLDEIGEISLALQPKLLRVLQDQEFERLGGTQTLKVDFRLIAATNSNLADRVRANDFRSDLFYRLSVFPIRVPPLRERREDIPLLVEHFVQKFARRMNRSITSIPRKTMDALISWDWPGNVRELENYMERSVILSQGSVLVSPLSELEMLSPDKTQNRVDQTLAAAEREHILRALRDAQGKIGGSKGAAVRLGLKRTTLQSKMKNLGISSRPDRP